jgi:lysophospholipase L1-like esterase
MRAIMLLRNSSTVRTRSQRWLANLALAALSVALVLGASEVILRIRAAGRPEPPPRVPRFLPCQGCGYAFGLNPAHPEISAQGLRDRDFEIPKPEGVFRALVLGDSVTYGVRVAPERAYPKVLERRLRALRPDLEVVNAGVTGFTPWNALHFYLEEGRRFEADLVVLTLCLNDVADPQLHWDALGKTLEEAAPESLPNTAYHEGPIRRQLRLHRLRSSPSLLVRTLAKRGLDRWRDHQLETLGHRVEGDRRWPVYLTAEHPKTIDVLLDWDSSEWRWLRGILDRLVSAVEADGARFVLAVAPLAYQIDPDYPFLPQALVARYCAERGIACVDLLPALREYPVEQTYLLNFSGVYDIWHWTSVGHQVAAAAFEGFVLDHGLIPEVDAGAPHRHGRSPLP